MFRLMLALQLQIIIWNISFKIYPSYDNYNMILLTKRPVWFNNALA
jgi:hypothetical protein